MDGCWTCMVGLPPALCLCPYLLQLPGGVPGWTLILIHHLAWSGTVNETSPYRYDHDPVQNLCNCVRKGMVMPVANQQCTVYALIACLFWTWWTFSCVSHPLDSSDLRECALLENKQTFHALTPKAKFYWAIEKPRFLAVICGILYSIAMGQLFVNFRGIVPNAALMLGDFSS